MVSDFSFVPKKVTGVRWILKRNNCIYALNPYTDQFIEMNKFGSAIWMLIDGKTSIISIINNIQSLINKDLLNKEKIEKDVVRYLERLQDCKMISF
jgi:hypothetical protein